MTCKIYIINLLFILFSCNKTILSKAVSPRINHVMLYVSNLEKSIGFYTRAFDLQVTNNFKLEQVGSIKTHVAEIYQDLYKVEFVR